MKINTECPKCGSKPIELRGEKIDFIDETDELTLHCPKCGPVIWYRKGRDLIVEIQDLAIDEKKKKRPPVMYAKGYKKEDLQ